MPARRRSRRRGACCSSGPRLAVLDENRLEHVRCVLTCVDGFFERLVDVLPAHERDRVRAAVEELGDRLQRNPVAFVLELAQLDQHPPGIFESLELRNRLAELAGRAMDDMSLLGRLAADLTDAV